MGTGSNGATLAQKIIARAAGRHSVHTGEIVICAVDLAMIHDSGGPRRVAPILDRLGVGPWDPAKVVLITDHYVPAHDEESQRIQRITREFAARYPLGGFYDGEGICHIVLPERGHLKPGMLVVGGDSHSPTGGAFGAYMFGCGATEMAGVLATGEIWLTVPETIVIELSGRLGPGVVAKDIMLFLCRQLGMDGGRYQAIEYRGEAVASLAMQDRMTLSNMTAELGAQAGLIAPDETTAAWLRAAGADPGRSEEWQSDAEAEVAEHHRFDAEALPPQVAAPHSPANAADVAEHAGTRFDVAYIGACTGAKLVDLQMAAKIMKGRKVASGVTLLVAPASRQDQAAAAAEGTLGILEEAGARLLPNACNICAGYGAGQLGDEVTCLSSTARNFRGRMGSPTSRVFLASPYTVAASAVAGAIADPRPMLDERRFS